MEVGIRKTSLGGGCGSQKTWYSWSIVFPKEFEAWLTADNRIGSLRVPGVIITYEASEGRISLIGSVDAQAGEQACRYVQYMLKRAQEYCRGFGIEVTPALIQRSAQLVELDDVSSEEPFNPSTLKF